MEVIIRSLMNTRFLRQPFVVYLYIFLTFKVKIDNGHPIIFTALNGQGMHPYEEKSRCFVITRPRGPVVNTKQLTIQILEQVRKVVWLWLIKPPYLVFLSVGRKSDFPLIWVPINRLTKRFPILIHFLVSLGNRWHKRNTLIVHLSSASPTVHFNSFLGNTLSLYLQLLIHL